jgi:ElaA protein
MTVNWICKKFSDLSPLELYHLLQLRSEVFVVEQNCVFLDMDNSDQQCFHLMGCIENKLVAYARIVPPGRIYKEASIGRVVTSPSVRKKGVGKLLMQKAIEICNQLFGNTDIRIGAQFYLKNFYGCFGFNQVSDVYLEDGIEHIYMLKNAST